MTGLNLPNRRLGGTFLRPIHPHDLDALLPLLADPVARQRWEVDVPGGIPLTANDGTEPSPSAMGLFTCVFGRLEQGWVQGCCQLREVAGTGRTAVLAILSGQVLRASETCFDGLRLYTHFVENALRLRQIKLYLPRENASELDPVWGSKAGLLRDHWQDENGSFADCVLLLRTCDREAPQGMSVIEDARHLLANDGVPWQITLDN